MNLFPLILNIAIENGPVEIVDLRYKMVDFSIVFCKRLPGRVYGLVGNLHICGTKISK